MVPSRGLFPAEDVFKHFTYTTTEDGREQKVDLIRAITNPRIQVAGRLREDGTFVIHLVESSPPPAKTPKTPPKDCPIRWIAFLKDGMYLLYSLPGLGPIGEDIRKVAFAGKSSEVLCRRALNQPTVWRVEFGLHRGRPLGSGGRFDSAKDFRQTVITDLRHLRQNGRPDTQLELARLWYQNSDDPTAEVDSLVTEIKRYGRKYKIRWEELKEEARRR
jgi:hypothetical protein